MKTSFRLLAAQTATSAATVTQEARSFIIGGLAMLGVGLAQPAKAQTPAAEPVQVTQPDGESLRVRLFIPAGQKASMQVIHLSTGQTLLNENHRTSYGTLLKFNGLPTGRYAVQCRVGASRYRYTVDVEAPRPGATSIAVRETTTRRVESGLATAAL
ncbi:hypothetical protein ACFST9_22745 [Hymenobacter monticola]|uniref:Uncharacterized protein n=1 Tax=Hymenobacter monticola TaxID=1705399 RepID=A0ABY4B8R2_9BACT|nr:hypothetical protein [Hymenobacter monticola]UOE34081.1 hypothetical protein MTP16_00165 [Hymenobacter monticola]